MEGTDKFGSSFGDDNELTYQAIIMKQIKKIVDIGSQDMYGGYNVSKNRVLGELLVYEPEYLVNTRQAFCNAVLMLKALAFHRYNAKYNKLKEHEIKNAKEMAKYFDEWKLSLDVAFKECEGKEFVDGVWVVNENLIKATQDEWFDAKIVYHRRLFEEICGFLQIDDVNNVGG